MSTDGDISSRDDDPAAIDRLTRGAFIDASQRLSRRGVLAKIGRLSLGVLGVSVLGEVLPVSRDVAHAGTYPCNAVVMCGFCGVQCGCANCSGSQDQCPNCACLGQSWVQCCCISGGACNNVRYLDCFKGSCTNTKFNSCQACTPVCCLPGYPDTGPYPTGCSGQAYMCTRVRVTTVC